MAMLVQLGTYGSLKTDDTKINGFYNILFVSEAYILQNSTQVVGQVISASE